MIRKGDAGKVEKCTTSAQLQQLQHAIQSDYKNLQLQKAPLTIR
ncbi:hypothetical protein LYNGBM3L_54840 [Moorena producens 3L]|uniref:Uncharacterized protein n=1 Tax=Moorena producens 3L TaxID=489825 RepID=F4XR12_9CYAN|nr:hypothetical protein LYNGBM3L_54840 [Moorena producens 3L]